MLVLHFSFFLSFLTEGWFNFMRRNTSNPTCKQCISSFHVLLKTLSINDQFEIPESIPIVLFVLHVITNFMKAISNLIFITEMTLSGQYFHSFRKLFNFRPCEIERHPLHFFSNGNVTYGLFFIIRSINLSFSSWQKDSCE